MRNSIYHHVALNCADPLITERFYTKYFGFTRSRVVPFGETQIVFIKSGDVYLELFEADVEAPAPAPTADGPHYPGPRHIAFKVDDVDAALAEIGDDAPITFGPYDFDDFIPGWRTVWISDPDGTIVELSHGYVDQEDVPPLDGQT